MENGTRGTFAYVEVTIIGKTHGGLLVVQSDAGLQMNIKPESFIKK